MGRIRDYESFCREQGLSFNLIVNTEYGGATSDQVFYERTLSMVDAYLASGGQADRYFVQSWYDYPLTVLPERDPHSMAALALAVVDRVAVAGSGASNESGKGAEK